MSSNKPVIISFEGCEGAGKSTATEIASTILRDEGASVETVTLGIYRYSFPLNLYRSFKRIFSSKKSNGNSSRGSSSSKYRKRTTVRSLVLLANMKWRLFKTERSKPEFIVTDRHYIDIFKQSRPDFLTLKAVKRLDSSDELVLLETDPETVRERRGSNPELVEKRFEQLEKYLEKTGIEYTKISSEDYKETQDSIKKIVEKYSDRFN